MAEKREPPEERVVSDDPHPTEPSEGAVDPGTDAGAERPPRPEEPAEGERG